jgi:outer membrane protein assembly complex protein YaeT
VVERGSAQDSLIIVGPGAQVGSVGFKFTGNQSFLASELNRQIELRGRGSFYGFRRLVGKLPLISAPASYSFDPIELQKDAVRLRRFYQQSGFVHPEVDYRVRTRNDRTLVDVDFVINEGPSVVLRDLTTVGPMGGPGPDIPDSLEGEWQKLLADIGSAREQRFGAAEGRSVEQQIVTWLRNRGYPDAAVRSRLTIDSVQNVADLTVEVNPGNRRRIGSITVDGNTSVSDRVVLREFPPRSGDWLAADALGRGRSRIQQVALFRQVSLDVPPKATTDSSVSVRIRVTEAHPRLSLAEIGYISDGAGLTGRVQWTHPNFTGGARSLTASLEAATGTGAIQGQGERFIRTSLTLTQPYVFTPGLLATVGPFAEYRDDYRDQSIALGITASLVRRIGDLSSIALQYQYSGRHIYEYRGGEVSPGNISLLTLLGLQDPTLIDSLGTKEQESSLGFTATLAHVDNVVDPHRGFLLRPSIKVTVPAGLNTSQFARLDVAATRFQPLSRSVVLAARASFGRLFPFGKSVPPPGGDPTFSFLHMRDESMTAGGTDDVRGWSTGLLGPKVPNVQGTIEGTDTVLTADRWAPIGALARLTGSLELRFPAPGLSPNWGTHVFLDSG